MPKQAIMNGRSRRPNYSDYLEQMVAEITKNGFVKSPSRSDPEYNQKRNVLYLIKDRLVTDKGHRPYWFRMNTSVSGKAAHRSSDLIGGYTIENYLVLDGRFDVYKNDVLAVSLLRQFWSINPKADGKMRQAMKYLLHEFDMHVESFCGHDWRALQLERKEDLFRMQAKVKSLRHD